MSVARFWADVVWVLSYIGDLLSSVPVAFGAALCGATVGAVVSNAISRRTQRWVLEEARKDRKDAKRQEDLAAAMSMSANIMKIVGYFGSIKAQLDRDLSAKDPPGSLPSSPWEKIRPFATVPGIVTYTESEAAFVVSLKDAELFLAIMELASRYSGFVQVPILYTRLWEERAELPSPQTTGGEMDRERRERHLNNLIEEMVPRARLNFAHSSQVFERFASRCRQVFGDDYPAWKLVDRWPEIILAAEAQTPPAAAAGW